MNKPNPIAAEFDFYRKDLREVLYMPYKERKYNPDLPHNSPIRAVCPDHLASIKEGVRQSMKLEVINRLKKYQKPII